MSLTNGTLKELDFFTLSTSKTAHIQIKTAFYIRYVNFYGCLNCKVKT
jgi:hypothetical protein